MHLYRLVGRVVVTDCDALECGAPDYEHTHVLAVNVLWPDRLTDAQVEAHVVGDLLAGDDDYSHHDTALFLEWTNGPTVTEVTDPALLRAAGVPESLIEEPDHV